MKKILILFVLLDLVFVGVILKITNEDNRRFVASVTGDAELTEGQQQKLDLMKSFIFNKTESEVILRTNTLQAACASFTTIELKFKALNMAFSGQEPLITHTFSCEEIKKDTSSDSMVTALSDLKSLRTEPVIKKQSSVLAAHAIYSDEEMPNDWRLFEIRFSGSQSFSISEVEINKILGEEIFKFSLN